VTGQILQPSDIRIKEVLRELEPREQLEKVRQIKIFQYKYKPEFVTKDENPSKDIYPTYHTYLGEVTSAFFG
jgi:hypothetical protein